MVHINKTAPLAAFALAIVAASAFAGAPPSGLTDLIGANYPHLVVDYVGESPLKGFYEVSISSAATRSSGTGYVSGDGRYLLLGELLDMDDGVSLTEARLKKTRLELLSELKPDEMITFLPENGKVKHNITVFTDVDCGYCRKLHREIHTYLDKGIAVHYVFFPRAGPGSGSWKKAEDVWCSADRRDALTRAKKGEPIEHVDCATPVQKHYDMVDKMGLRGTPAIITEDGRYVSGYRNATALLKEIENDTPAARVAMPKFNPKDARATPVAGVKEQAAGATGVYYISADGHYSLRGSMIDLKTQDDLTDKRLAEERLKLIDSIDEKNMIIFKPEKVRHTVTVFTDIDCGYCRKLHSQMEAFQDAGIEIRYVFFPRSGPNSSSWKKAENVWCSDDRQDALTRAKKGEKIEAPSCKTPVESHYAMVHALGLTGTPSIITETGELIPGYMDAPRLTQALEKEQNLAAAN